MARPACSARVQLAVPGLVLTAVVIFRRLGQVAEGLGPRAAPRQQTPWAKEAATGLSAQEATASRLEAAGMSWGGGPPTPPIGLSATASPPQEARRICAVAPAAAPVEA